MGRNNNNHCGELSDDDQKLVEKWFGKKQAQSAREWISNLRTPDEVIIATSKHQNNSHSGGMYNKYCGNQSTSCISVGGESRSYGGRGPY